MLYIPHSPAPLGPSLTTWLLMRSAPKSNLWNVSVRVAVPRLSNLTNGIRPRKVQVDGKQSCKYGNRFYILSSLANLQQVYCWSRQQGKRPTGEIVQVCNRKSIMYMYNCWDLGYVWYMIRLFLCTTNRFCCVHCMLHGITFCIIKIWLCRSIGIHEFGKYVLQ